MKCSAAILIVLLATVVPGYSQNPAATASPSSTTPVISGSDDSTAANGRVPIKGVVSLKIFLLERHYKLTAAGKPLDEPVVVSGERSSRDASDIQFVMVGYGRGKNVESIQFTWRGIGANAPDNKMVGTTLSEWKQTVCELVDEKSGALDEWIKKITDQCIHDSNGENVSADIKIGAIQYKFSGSMKSTSMTVDIMSAVSPIQNLANPAEAKLLSLPLQFPQIVISNKLKQIGFAASFRLTDKQKKLAELAHAKDVKGIIALVTGKEASDPTDADWALERLSGSDGSYFIAVQSPNVTCKAQFFEVKGVPRKGPYLAVSAIELPEPSAAVLVDKYGKLNAKIKVTNSPFEAPEQHPSGNGFLYSRSYGKGTFYFYEDTSDARGATKTVNEYVDQFKKTLSKLNRRQELGELSPEEAMKEGVAAFQAFESSIKSVVLQNLP